MNPQKTRAIDVRVEWTKSGIPTEQMLIDAAAAGLVSRKDEPYSEFIEDIDIERAKNFLAKMIKLGHESVLEHIVFQFWLSMSRVASHQQVRHRMASYTQMSLRQERDLTTDAFVVPPQIKEERSKKKTLRNGYRIYKPQLIVTENGWIRGMMLMLPGDA